MADLHRLLEHTSSLHKHLCPRQVLGVRMGMYAGELLDLELPQSDKRLFAFVETDGCFADGVSVASGCWFGHRTMRLDDQGKVAVVFVDTRTERALRIWPSAEARHLASVLIPDARSHWHAQLEAYQHIPAADLLCVAEVDLTVCLAAIISRPGVRVQCDACGEEILNERELVIEGRTLCHHCAGNAYWSLKGESWLQTALAEHSTTCVSH